MEALTGKEVKAMMVEYLVNSQGVSADLAADGTAQVESLGVDSLSLLEMLFEVEGRYGIHVEDLAPLKGMSIDAMAEFLARLQPQRETA